ncbi:MAG: NAD-dependent epimerase/dehydratase [Gemmatimonadales bacterium]|nr:NAD-dependent epimerase/dehydratase [Gemmatimonadales bacterium]
MSSLVTGAGGFVGQWLIRSLLSRHERVTGFTFDPPVDNGILSAEQRKAVDWVEGDIRDTRSIEAALDRSAPDAIYHLAGITFVPQAGADPAAAYEVNTLGAARLISAVVRTRDAGKISPRILMVGSAEQYGAHDRVDGPLKESAPQKPVTVYAASKAAQEIIGLQAFNGLGIDVIATRSFNHSGPGQEKRFLLPGIVDRIKSLGRSSGKHLPIGNTTATRDFLHVSDVAAAYIALMELGQPGEVYNVSSGEGHTVQELLELTSRVTGVDAKPQRDESLVRPVDVEWLVGDNAKLRAQTGWAPRLGVEDIVRDLWEAGS